MARNTEIVVLRLDRGQIPFVSTELKSGQVILRRTGRRRAGENASSAMKVNLEKGFAAGEWCRGRGGGGRHPRSTLGRTAHLG